MTVLCVPFIVAHWIKPGWATALAAATAYVVWYACGFLAIPGMKF